MKKFDEYFNAMLVCSLGAASIGSYIDKFDGAWIGVSIGAVLGIIIVFLDKKK